MKHAILFLVMAVLAIALIVLTRAILAYQRSRLRFYKVYIIAFVLLLYHILPSFFFEYFYVNDKVMLRSAPWRTLWIVRWIQTPVLLALIAFFLIRLFLLLQREAWRRSWLFLFWGVMLIPISYRLLDAASILSLREPLRSRLHTAIFLILILAFYGSLIAVSWRAQVKRFAHLSPPQAHHLKWFGRAMGIIAFLSFIVDLANNFVSLKDLAAGLLSILPVFLFIMASLLFLDRFLVVMYPILDAGKTREERFQTLIREYGISNREKEIVLLICQGKTNRKIEETLFISMPTVKDHVSNIFRKTGVTNRVQLAALFHFTAER